MTAPSAHAPAVHQGSSFAYSFSFLPGDQRAALRTIYAFCRATDDLVDNNADAATKAGDLRRWRADVEAALRGAPPPGAPVLGELADVVRRFQIPAAHVFELLRGVEMDLEKKRYETFAELKEYCYHVASSVGLMSLAIFGPRHPGTRQYAVELGIALQLTNIIRDVGADARLGRVYIPREDLVRFGCTEEEILGRRPAAGFLPLMEFQAARAKTHFRLAQEALPAGDRRAMFAATIMERIYYRTLVAIERGGFRVFDGPVHLGRAAQLGIALRYWFQRRILGL
jgi:phytoene synthase